MFFAKSQFDTIATQPIKTMDKATGLQVAGMASFFVVLKVAAWYLEDSS
jgi:hypothetical protein